jgi:dynein heavy chain
MITKNKYNFCVIPDYYAPTDLNYDDQIEFIRSFPVVTLPEALGLHSNAKISRDYQETQQLFNDILLTLPREVCSFIIVLHE